MVVVPVGGGGLFWDLKGCVSISLSLFVLWCSFLPFFEVCSAAAGSFLPAFSTTTTTPPIKQFLNKPQPHEQRSPQTAKMDAQTPIEKRPSHSSFSASSTSPRNDAPLAAKLRALAAVDNARLAATALALLMGMTVLGVAGNTLAVYDHTKLPATPAGSVSALPGLWPAEFNMRPTVSLVVGSVFVVLAGVAGLVGGKVKAVSFFFLLLRVWDVLLIDLGAQVRANKMVHTSTSLAAPVVGLVAALVAVVLFYAVNASEEVDTFLSWTCRWKAVPMATQPRWDTLCAQSWTGVYMAVLLIPVEAAALGMAVWCRKAEREVDEYEAAQGK